MQGNKPSKEAVRRAFEAIKPELIRIIKERKQAEEDKRK